MYFSLDWLKNQLTTLPSEKEKNELIINFITSASDFLIDDCYTLCKSLLEKAEHENDSGLKAFATVQMGYFHLTRGQNSEYLRWFQEGENHALVAQPSFATVVALQMCAFNHWSAGERDRGFELAYISRKMNPPGENEGLGWSDFQLGVFHSDLKDYDNSRKYFLTAEKYAEGSKLTYQLARIHSGLAAIDIAEEKFNDALIQNEKALAGYRACGHSTAISRALNDLGVIYSRKGIIEKAKENLTEAMNIRRKMNYRPGLITTEIELARIFISEQNFTEAEKLLKDALFMSNETNARQKAVTCHMLLAEIYKLTGQFQTALEQLETGYRVKVELSGEEASNRIKHLQQKNATEQAEQEAEIHRLKNVELKQAYDEIEEKNKSILDSINYAKRIQTALLGSAHTIQRNLPEHFIHYNPKDIVSGDFYWCAEKNDLFFFAVADCTGHGVPGAFMSLLNINLLNRAVSENNLDDPAAILDFIRTHVIASLNAEGQEKSRDGMDAVVFALDKTSGTLRFACANNVLLHVRNKHMSVHGPDKFPVGLSPTEELQPFTPHQIPLQTGDSIFISTDGYADQFGGEKGKKFKQKRLRELLTANSDLAVTEQSRVLGETFHTWKGNLEQVDDVLVFGFKYI